MCASVLLINTAAVFDKLLLVRVFDLIMAIDENENLFFYIIQLLGNMNVCARFHGSPSNSC